MSDHSHNAPLTPPHKGVTTDYSRSCPNQSVHLPNKNQAKPRSLSNIPKINRYKIATLSNASSVPRNDLGQPCNCRSHQDRHPACPDEGRERSIAKRRDSLLANRHCILTVPACNTSLHAAFGYSSHSPLVTRHCSFDRYTCRTKNAVSPAPSTKLPNLIDTDFGPRPVRCNIVLRATSDPIFNRVLSCNIRYMAQRLRPAPAQISRHPCQEIFRVTPIPSTKLPKYLGTLAHPIRMRILRANNVSRRIWYRHPAHETRRPYRQTQSQFGNLG